MGFKRGLVFLFVIVVTACTAVSASAASDTFGLLRGPSLTPHAAVAGTAPAATMPTAATSTAVTSSVAASKVATAVRDQVIVKYRSGVTAAAARAHAKGLGATVKKQIVGPVVPHGRLAVVRSDTLTTRQLMARFEADPRVEYAEPDTLLRSCATSNDPRFWELWGMQQISAPKAWDVNKGTAGVVVADIDSGVNYTHPDIWYNSYYNAAEYDGTAWVDDDSNGYVDDVWGWDAIGNDGSPGDGNGHGTHTAGTMAARGNNAAGVTGVCWYSRIMPCRFLDNNGDGYTSDAVECVNYVVAQKQHGVNVVAINASWGGGAYSTALLNAITAASSAGIVFVAAAGNDGSNNDATSFYPASYNVPNVISVAAVDSHNRLAAFSNYGINSVDLAAPGVDVLSTVPTSKDPSGYTYMSGTSMAAPHVTGAIALCAAAYPSETMAQRIDRVVSNTDYCSWLWPKIKTGGVLDVAKALGLSGPSYMEIPGINMPKSYTTGGLGEGNGEAVYRVFLMREQVTARITNASGADYDLYLFAPGTTTVADKGVALAAATGDTYPKELTYAVPANGVYYLNVSRVSGEGNFGIACNSREDDIPGLPFPSGDVIPWIDYSAQFDAVRSIHLGYGERLTTSIVSPPANSDLRLFLFPPGAFTVWSNSYVDSATSGDFPRTIEHPCWQSGTYYVDAHAVTGGGWFTLTHSVTPAYDNDIPGSPIVGSGYSGLLMRDEDRDDVWSVYLSAHQTLTANITGDAATTDWDVFIYPKEATTVEGHTGWGAASQTGAYPETATYTAPSAGTYYVDLHAASGLGAYTFTWSTLYDTIAPTTSVTGLQGSGTTGWRATAQLVTLTPTDTGGSGLAQTMYTIDHGEEQVYKEPFTVSGSGSHGVTYWSVDHAANQEVALTGYVNIDVTPPVTYAGGLTDKETWRNAPATVRLEPEDSQSGVRRTYYVLDEVEAPYKGAFTVSEPGSHRVLYWSDDRVGNEEERQTGYVNIDVTPPAVTDATLSPAPTSAGWNNGDVVVTLSATDKGGSEVWKTQYSVHGSGVWTDAVSSRFTVPGPADHGNDGVHGFEFRAIDRAGNVSEPDRVAVRIDTTAPLTKAQAPDLLPLDDTTWHAGPLSVVLTPSDPTAADGTCSGMSGGLAATQYSIDGGASWQSGTSILFPRWKRGGGTGRWTVLYYSTDAAGNGGSPQSARVLIDNQAPVSYDDAPAGVQPGPVTVHVTVVDADSGPASVWHSLDGGPWSPIVYPGAPGAPVTVSGAGVHTLRYYAVDGAGNAEAGFRVCQVTIGG